MLMLPRGKILFWLIAVDWTCTLSPAYAPALSRNPLAVVQAGPGLLGIARGGLLLACLRSAAKTFRTWSSADAVLCHSEAGYSGGLHPTAEPRTGISFVTGLVRPAAVPDPAAYAHPSRILWISPALRPAKFRFPEPIRRDGLEAACFRLFRE